MEFMVFVLYFLTGLLALEGLSALLRKRARPGSGEESTPRPRATGRAGGGAEESILRSGDHLRLPNLGGLEKLLYRAGGSLTVSRFLGLSVIMAGGGFLTAYLLTENPPPIRCPPSSRAFFPGYSIRRAAAKRMRSFDEQLPDALELMTRSMRTGHALGAGFHMVGEELPDPIGTRVRPGFGGDPAGTRRSRGAREPDQSGRQRGPTLLQDGGADPAADGRQSRGASGQAR